MRLFLINMIALTNSQIIYVSVATVIIILILCLLLIFIFHDRFQNKNFKAATYFKLSKIAMHRDFLLLNNFKVDFDDSHVGYIDHLLISNKYIYAINDFSISGVVSGELKGRTLNVINRKKEVTQINNPLNYNINLIKRFNLYNNLDQSFVKGVVVINNDSEICVENLSDQFTMIRRKDLNNFIKKCDSTPIKNFNEESIVKFINKLSKENH